MGLDMYLCGRKSLMENFKEPARNRTEDGHRVSIVEIDLGYWRKHPDLHGFIVQNFAEGQDTCQEIDLGEADLQKVVEAVERGELPETEGFFFGSSQGYWQSPEGVEETTKYLMGAIRWLRSAPPDERRSLYYQASW